MADEEKKLETTCETTNPDEAAKDDSMTYRRSITHNHEAIEFTEEGLSLHGTEVIRSQTISGRRIQGAKINDGIPVYLLPTALPLSLSVSLSRLQGAKISDVVQCVSI